MGNIVVHDRENGLTKKYPVQGIFKFLRKSLIYFLKDSNTSCQNPIKELLAMNLLSKYNCRDFKYMRLVFESSSRKPFNKLLLDVIMNQMLLIK